VIDQHANLFLQRLATGRPLLLDGATGTELQRHGVDTGLPLWSARALVEAPETLRSIHADYIHAGADIITTNTFRTHRRTLERTGIGSRTRELTQLAVEIAQTAAQSVDRKIFIAGSMSPLEDCYAPELVPPDDDLWNEHAEMARDLAQAGCDLLLVETMNTIREAVSAAHCAQATALPVGISFVVGPAGLPPEQANAARADEISAEPKLLSGESISAAVAALRGLQPTVILVNCVPLAFIDRAFEELRAAHAGPIGLYANVGHADNQAGWILTDDVLPHAYARQARRWLQQGAAIIGGCCGTTPAHIAALKEILRDP
jgi:S-methylmethionine-dependent homocysteine/selenocysteine methylase